MAKTQITIGITDAGVDIYSMTDGSKNKIELVSEQIKKTGYDEDYYVRLTDTLKKYMNSHPGAQNSTVTLVLPDWLIATDTISIPVAHGIKANEHVDITIKTLYKNISELKINKQQLAANKQAVIFSLTMLRNDVYTSFHKALSNAKLAPSVVTFTSNAAVDGAFAISSKTRNGTFLFLDIKEGRSIFAFVNKGRVVGYYPLPFGVEALSANRVTPEETLFNHATAELAVMNANERAKAKKITMDSADDDINENIDGEENDGGDEFEQAGAGINATQFESLPRRGARKLPKFMQRPTPVDEDEFVCENFRVFEKWALNLIRYNPSITAAGDIGEVVVNISDDYAFIFDKLKEERDENGVDFSKLDTKNEKDIVFDNLELYGGFFASQYNKNNNF